MDSPGSGLQRAILPPLIVLAVGGVGLSIAYVLETTPAYEWSLSIGAPSILTVFIGLIYLAVVLIWYVVSRR